MDTVRSADEKKKIQFFRKSLSLQEKAMGVHVMRVTGSEMLTMRKQETLGVDIVADAVAPDSISRNFSACNDALAKGGDAVNASIDAILEQMGEEKKKGITAAASQAAFFLAWSMPKGGRFASDDPALVGIATVYRSVSSERFETHRGAFKESSADQHLAVLQPFFNGAGGGYPGDFKRAYLWLDLLCSNEKGVGRLLMNAVYASALSRKLKGVLCAPSSKAEGARALFTGLGFETLIETVKFKEKGRHGSLLLQRTVPVKLHGVHEEGVDLCVRTTGKAPVWRCPYS